MPHFAFLSVAPSRPLHNLLFLRLLVFHLLLTAQRSCQIKAVVSSAHDRCCSVFHDERAGYTSFGSLEILRKTAISLFPFSLETETRDRGQTSTSLLLVLKKKVQILILYCSQRAAANIHWYSASLWTPETYKRCWLVFEYLDSKERGRKQTS
jgi:hypothetical protein